MSLTTDYSHDGYIVTDDDMPETRFIVWHDTEAIDPRDEWDGVQIGVYAAGYRSTAELRSESDADTRTMRAFIRAYDQTGDDARALRIAQRYARVFDSSHVIATHSARGYSQSDWADAVIVCHSGDDANTYAAEWAQWARGDVFAVMCETYIPCPHPQACHAITRCAGWEPVTDAHNSIPSSVMGNIYADNAEDAVMQYLAMGE